MLNRYLYIMFLTFLILDTAFSFYQHYRTPLDGDLSEITLPIPDKGSYYVLHDPFGISALVKNEKYLSPNRFFAHWTTSTYFKKVPLFLQKFVDPIESIYLSCAIAKTIIQLLIIYLIAIYISGTGNLLNNKFLYAAIIITPLFQTAGYNRYMGIIDRSITYTFFYALPLGLLLLFFLPFYRSIYNQHKPKNSYTIKVLLAIMIVFLALNGPLVPGVVLIVCPFILVYLFWINYDKSLKFTFTIKILSAIKRIPNYIIFYFVTFCFLSLYSLYIGMNNDYSIKNYIPLLERYAKLPVGIFKQFTSKLGFPLLFVMITINAIIIKKHFKNAEGKKIIFLLKWIGLFSLCYILLLPLGGFRGYRPNILRYDTIMPITIAIIFIFGISTYFLIINISKKYKTLYTIGVTILLLIFTNADQFDNPESYVCERQAIEYIAQSNEQIVLLNSDCPVMAWDIISDFTQSERNAKILFYWNVTPEKKYYFQKDN